MTNGFRVPPTSRILIRNFTNELRKMIGIETLNFPIIDFMETVFYEHYEVASKQDMKNCYGLVIPEEKRIIIREDVYNRACLGEGRDRFTIAHEIGHFILHSDLSLSRVDTCKGRTIKSYEDSEWQANCFASELLIPVNNTAIQNMSVQEIVRNCGVSYQAADIAYKEIIKQKNLKQLQLSKIF